MLDPSPHLRTRTIGRDLHLFDEVTSTNDLARELAQEGAEHGVLVAARSQTAGRGRRGRRWFSPAGAGLYASFVLRPKLELDHLSMLTFCAVLAAHRAVFETSGVDALIRWPNDLLGADRLQKLAGILLETSLGREGLDYAIVGVGINLARSDRPEAIASYATSIAEQGGTVDRSELLGALSNELERELDRLLTAGPAPLLADWTERAVGLGQDVSVVRDGQPHTGRFVGLAPDGALELDGPNGLERHYVGELRVPGAPVQPEW